MLNDSDKFCSILFQKNIHKDVLNMVTKNDLFLKEKMIIIVDRNSDHGLILATRF